MLHNYKGQEPEIAEGVFTAPGCQIIGDVKIEAEASIWYNAVLRGDLAPIQIGRRSNVQENTSLHVDFDQPLIVKDNVTIGHGAILHGCTIEDNCLIGMGATILNGAVIGEGSIIGAGALVTENKKIPPHSLVVGVPGKAIRELTEENTERIKESADEYYKLAQDHMTI